LTEGGRRGRGLHVSEGEERKAVWAGRRRLGWLADRPVLGREEVGHDRAKNRRWAKVQKEFFFDFHLIFRIWQNFGKLYKEI
jgi:hypothetical protein